MAGTEYGGVATGREAFDCCDGAHEGCGGDGVAIQLGMQWLVIAARTRRGLRPAGSG